MLNKLSTSMDKSTTLLEKNIKPVNSNNNDNLDLLIIIPSMPIVYGAGSLSNGPLVIGSYLDSKGYSVKVLDNNSLYKHYTDDDLIKKIALLRPTTVGLSVNMLNALNSYNLLKKIKIKFPNLIVHAGGLHTFDEPEEVNKQGFNITFVGETEISLVKFYELIYQQRKPIDSNLFNNIEFLNDLKLIPGLIFNHKEKIINTGHYKILDDLDELSIINHDLLNLEDFIYTSADHHVVTTSLNFQRGCPFECTFCKADFMGGKLRSNSADFIINSIKHIHEKYGQTHFTLTDSNFTIPRSRLIEFANKMIASGLSKVITFWIQTSITATIKDKDLKLLKKAGLIRISFGVERFSTESRKQMIKIGTQEQIFDVLRRIKENRIMCEINILVNFPSETKETIKAESDYLLKALPYVDFFRINYLIPIPGTAIYESKKVKSNWYLNEKINFKKSSYYDLAFEIGSPGVEFNLFNLSPEVLKAIRKFKERFYIKSLFRLNNSFIFKILLITDICLAKFSYFLYNVNPHIENVLLWPFKIVRASGAKHVIAIWFNPKNKFK